MQFRYPCTCNHRSCVIYSDGDKFTIKDKDQIYLQASVTDARANYIGGSDICVSDSMRGVTCHFDEGQTIDAWMMLSYAGLQSFYE